MVLLPPPLQKLYHNPLPFHPIDPAAHPLPQQLSAKNPPYTNSSKRSVTPCLVLCGLANGLISTGCSHTNVGWMRSDSAVASNSSFSNTPTLNALRTCVDGGGGGGRSGSSSSSSSSRKRGVGVIRGSSKVGWIKSDSAVASSNSFNNTPILDAPRTKEQQNG